jgi:hypothetical protein
MLRSGKIRMVCDWRIALGVLTMLVFFAGAAGAQTEPGSPYYSRVNTFGFLAAYSNDSSHMLLGVAENRKLLNFGATYSRRLFHNRTVNWMYNAEVLPVALESDPVLRDVTTYTLPYPSPPLSSSYEPITACHSGSGTMTFTADGTVYSYNYADSCSRRWTIGEGISPVGFNGIFCHGANCSLSLSGTGDICTRHSRSLMPPQGRSISPSILGWGWSCIGPRPVRSASTTGITIFRTTTQRLRIRESTMGCLR